MSTFRFDFSDVIGIENADFITHLHYINYLSGLSKNLRLTCKQETKHKINRSPIVNKKVKLIDLTIKSVEKECSIIETDKEYASICVSWLPVKAYYAIYNMMLLLSYLISSDEAFLAKGHIPIINYIKSQIKAGDLAFNTQEFNVVNEAKVVNGWTIPKGENVRIESEHRNKQVYKKLLDYAKQEYRRFKRRKRLGKIENEEFLRITTISLFEFFYWYRIKANYRDLEFISKGISDNNFKNFFLTYYSFMRNMCEALKLCINELAEVRFGEKVF